MNGAKCVKFGRGSCLIVKRMFTSNLYLLIISNGYYFRVIS